MPVNRTKLAALLVGLLATAAAAGTAAASHEGTPGVTKSTIVIGGTFPYSGPASLYKTIPSAEQAFYAYVNAKYHGVHGRKIKDITLDDQYNPAETPGEVKQLVEKDHVFAIVGSLGTAPGLSTWGYLNKRHIPQVLLATGDAYWGNCVHHVCQGSTKPWTMGWQPDYPGEAKLYAKYILQHKKNAKIGVLYQGDAYGKNYLAGLKTGLGSHTNEIVDAESYSVSDPGPVIQAHVGKIAASGANVFVIFATPTAAITALATEGHIPGWNPLTINNNVSANRLFMQLAASNGANPNGVLSTTYVASQTAQANLPGMKLAKQIIHKYSPGGAGSLDKQFASGDNNLVYGLAVGWTFWDALKHAGKNPTRTSLMHALRHMNEKNNPFIYPGMVVKTSKKRAFPMEQLIFEKWAGGAGGDWKTFGKVLNSGH
ncbi:MAG TPA: ABC transporter substrate-binding protein [Gaiellaceae bacterium]|nr:ABC transporter substrate-binding protein [Gaiellaceae bacterium]